MLTGRNFLLKRKIDGFTAKAIHASPSFSENCALKFPQNEVCSDDGAGGRGGLYGEERARSFKAFQLVVAQRSAREELVELRMR